MGQTRRVKADAVLQLDRQAGGLTNFVKLESRCEGIREVRHHAAVYEVALRRM